MRSLKTWAFAAALTAATLLCTAQVQIDNVIELTGGGILSRVTGIDTAFLPSDAVPLKMVEAPYYVDSVTASDINTYKDSSNAEVILSTQGLPQGYSLSGFWVNVDTPFVSPTCLLVFDAIWYQSTNKLIAGTLGSHSMSVKHSGRFNVSGSYIHLTDEYLPNIVLKFTFNGCTKNPGDLGSGSMRVHAILSKLP